MASRSFNQESSWFKLRHSFYQDDQLLQVPVQARWLFLSMVGLSHAVKSHGKITPRQCLTLAAGMSKVSRSLVQLRDAELITYDQGEDAYWICDGQRWDLVVPGDGPLRDPAGTGGGQAADIRPRKAAGQKTQRPVKTEPAGSRARAHVEKERQKEREEERTPSGSVRSSSAQAAPRVAGGATQPAPVAEVPQGGTMAGAEARNAIRETLNKAKQTVPGSTGRDTNFSKYNPDRPITPINSAVGSDWDTE